MPRAAEVVQVVTTTFLIGLVTVTSTMALVSLALVRLSAWLP
jgi:hypothetical protein